MEAEKVKRSVDKYYFRCYDSLELHNTMMKDRQRLEFYNRAIVGNAHLFKGKTVIDVGSGLGVLSIFAAQAGAKKVIATEVSPKINDLALKAFKRNGVDHIVQLRQGRIEDLKIDDDIDIIISEWMGYCLNYEKMLPSVIWARNKYKPKLMIPNEASLLVCGFHDQEFYKEQFRWTHGPVLDLDLSSFTEQECHKMKIKQISKDKIVTTSHKVGHFNLQTMEMEDCGSVSRTNFELKMKENVMKNEIHGLVVYFEAHLVSGKNGRLTLTNSPLSDECTHWLQSLCLFKEPLIVNWHTQRIVGTFELGSIDATEGRGIKVLISLDQSNGISKEEKCNYEFILP